MSLYEQGLFQLDDPVSRWVPSWDRQQVYVSGEGETMRTEAPVRPVSIRDLLRHTAGLTYGGGLPGVGIQPPVDPVYRSLKVRSVGGSDSMVTFMDKLGQIPLAYQPGERWMYSLATDACGALVEIISGMPFAQYLQQTIFDPLGMTDTAFHVSADKQPRLAANYQRGADKQLALIDDPATSAYLKVPGFCSGGGGLTGTTADYLRFCEMLRRGGELDGARIIGPRTLAMMHMNHLKDGQDLTTAAIGAFSETANAGVGFGLGFASTMDQVAAGVLGGGDYYWGGAASTIFAIDPKEQLSMVFMTQLMPSSTFNFRGQLKNLLYGAIVD
jgi:CubicO group peptidase (beta-lactamase class C family)